MATVLTAEVLLSPEKRIREPILILEDGIIDDIRTREANSIPSSAEHIDFPGCTLVPTLFDIHTHGAMGHDVMEATPEALTAIGHFLASHGVGAFLPTTMSAPMDTLLHSLEGLAKLIGKKTNGSRPLGIHLEGPFLSHPKRGAHPSDWLLPPSVKVFDRMWHAAQGHIKVLTVAPELPGAAELTAHATKLGVRVSIGHSDSGSIEAREVIAAGASSATHTFNAMRPLDHRHPGVLGVALTTDEIYAEIISDGVHVDPAVVKLFWRAKGPDRAILVTDAMSATGMPDGTYRLGDLPVVVENGKCLYEGVLAGSVLTLDRAVRNFRDFTGAEWSQAIAAASRNPARMTGLDDRIGSLQPGRWADIVVLSPEGKIVATMLSGRVVYRG
ncbi:MAG TPA: N-acetylglucosamine-6-phosphate deacetylase [Acidisarcina sp.]|nr:N-acetylglucosamine-6-phosphate deacetylase [Acidisarcina sp.]